MNVKQFSPDVNVEQLEADELLMAHTSLHSFYREFRLGRDIEGWDSDTIIEMHQKVKDEMDKRGIEHQKLSELDEDAVEQSANVVQEWVSKLVEAEDPSEFVQSNPPEMDWYVEAVEVVEDIDQSIDLTDYVTLSATQVGELDSDEHPVDWMGEVGVDQVVGYSKRDDVGVVLSKQKSVFELHFDGECIEQSESGISTYESYQKIADLLEDDEDVEEIKQEILEVEQEWDVPQNPSSFGMAEPVVDWSEVDTTLEAYLDGMDTDAESWEDLSEDAQVEISRYHAASSSGVPAENFSDLWGPHHNADGDVVRSGVIAAKQANAGARSEPNRPDELEDDINNHLNEHLANFNQEFGDEEAPLPDSVDQGVESVQGMVLDDESVDDHRWYVWDQEEAEEWLEAHGFDASEPEEEGEFLSYVQNDAQMFDEVETEWRGPRIRPWKFVPQLDDRPVMVTIGYQGEDEMIGQVQAVKFQVEEPPTLPVNQMSVQETEKDWYWYRYNRQEAKMWLKEQGISAGIGEENGSFVKFEVESPDQYQKLTKRWQGKRNPPSDLKDMAGGEKPRRITYGVNQEGEKELQAVEFLVEPTIEQKAMAFVEENNVDLSDVEVGDVQ